MKHFILNCGFKRCNLHFEWMYSVGKANRLYSGIIYVCLQITVDRKELSTQKYQIAKPW